MSSPVLASSDQQYSPGADASTLTSEAFAVADGDVLVVKATTWTTTTSVSTPTGGGQTFVAAQLSAPDGFRGWSGTWVCTVTGNPGSFSISTTPSAASRHSMVVEHWTSAQVDAVPAVFTVDAGSGDPMSAPFTTTGPGSVISFAVVDENSRDPAGHTWTPDTTVEDGLYDGHNGSNSVQYFGYTPIPAAGATTIDLTIPAGSVAWTISGVEVKAASSAPEVVLAFDMSAAAAMAAGLGPVETTMTANFAATGTMTESFNVPTAGPVDPIGTPVANQLLTCLTDQLQGLPSPPKYIQLRVGQETGPLIGANVDECCAGLAWVRIANIYPSWDSFPAADNTWLPCGPLAYAVVLEMGVAFCMPWSDSDDSFDNQDPPNEGDWTTAFETQMQHQTLMRRAAACCWRPTQRRAVGEWTPLPVEGGCTGGKLTVTVSVPAPCADC
jgi:hypothetical protein